MGTPNRQNNLLVKTKKYSAFPFSADVKTTYEIGKVVPFHKVIELMPGESWDCRVQGLTRFLPMSAPVMQRYEQDMIAMFVPYRLLWSEEAPIWDSNKFFNPSTLDANRPAVPFVKISQLFDSNFPQVNKSLFDYLGYPTFSNLYENLLAPTVSKFYLGSFFAVDATGINNQVRFNENASSISSLLDLSAADAGGYIEVVTDSSTVNPIRIYFYQDPSNLDPSDYTEDYPIKCVHTFFSWLLSKFPVGSQDVLAYGSDIQDPTEGSELSTRSIWVKVDSIEKVIAGLPGSYTVEGLWNSYLNYVFTEGVLSAVAEREVSLLPWLAYHKAYSDWFLNTTLIDPDAYMSALYNFTDQLVNDHKTLAEISSGHSSAGTAAAFISNCISDGDPCPRMWMDDYFTSAFPSASNGSDVSIPVNGTIPQLWTANRLQEFRMRVQLAGKRFIDQIRALWGVDVPDMRLQRTEVIGRWKTNLIVSDVLQNSTSTESSKLGEPAGYATAYGSDRLGHYTAQEPGLIVIVGSIRPTSAYVDQVSRLIYKSDYYDFENPIFDNVGMQAIMSDEIQPSLNGSNSIFGYTPRRYAEYMQNFNEVHGDFKLSLDYWHSARKFKVAPALNPDFISFSPEDNVNRIFADQAGSNVLSQFYFDMVVSRPLSRYVNYHL